MNRARDLEEAQMLALAIVDTLPEPFVVLDSTLNILAASRCFYEVYNVDPEQALGRSFLDLSAGQWDVPGLRQLLGGVAPEQVALEGFEFQRDFPHLGARTIQLNALPLREAEEQKMVLVAIKDITDWRAAEKESKRLLEHTEELLEQQKILMREMQHRIANSLQIIASILLLKAGAVTSEEAKAELREAHRRLMSVAEVQRHLNESGSIEQIEMGPYLTKLCDGLASSMVRPSQDIEIMIAADPGVLPSSHAVSIGLIVTELVINSLKYAFADVPSGAVIQVNFEIAKADWKLTVADNGGGRKDREDSGERVGLGTALIAALAKQMKAQVAETSTDKGMTVEVTRATFDSRLPRAA